MDGAGQAEQMGQGQCLDIFGSGEREYSLENLSPSVVLGSTLRTPLGYTRFSSAYFYNVYRVTLVVEYLGWVDLDLGSSPGWWATTVAT